MRIIPCSVTPAVPEAANSFHIVAGKIKMRSFSVHIFDDWEALAQKRSRNAARSLCLLDWIRRVRYRPEIRSELTEKS